MVYKKWQFSLRKVMAGCEKSPNDDAVRPPGLRTVVTAPSVRLDGGIVAQTVERADSNLTDFSRHD